MAIATRGCFSSGGCRLSRLETRPRIDLAPTRDVGAAMAQEQASEALPTHRRIVGWRLRPTDSYGLVLLLIILDYVAVSALAGSPLGRLTIVILLGVTVLFALR